MQVGVRQGRLVVTGLPAGGQAEQAGVAAGDELVSVEGRELEGLGVADVEALLRGPSGTPVVLRLRRRGRLLRRVVKREIK
jgi:carboxyl-terminal processing protease